MLYCVSTMYVASQEYNFQNFGEYEGLSHPMVKAVVQDSIGYGWVGTSEGLYWYDGQYFDVFKHSYSDTSSIAGDNITSLYVDPNKKHLWIGTNFAGFSCLDIKTYRFENFQRSDDENDSKGIGAINSIIRIDEFILLGTESNGLQAYSMDTKQYSTFTIDDASNYSVTDIKKLKDQVVIATDRGLYAYDTNLLKSKKHALEKSSWEKDNELVNSMSIIGDSVLVYNTFHQLIKINTQSKELLFEDESKEVIFTKHTIDANGQIWLGTNGNGLLCFGLDGKLIKIFEEEDKERGSLASDWVNCVSFGNKHSILWVGTKDGLSMLDYSKNKFKQFKIKDKTELKGANIYFVFKDTNKAYWWWAYSGLMIAEEGKPARVFQPINDVSFEGDTIWSGIEDRDKNLYLCSSNGLIKINLSTKYTERINLVDPKHPNVDYRFLSGIIEHDDYLWISARNGIIKYHPQSGEVVSFPFPQEYKNKRNVVVVSRLLYDKEDVVWVGDLYGYIISLETRTGIYNRYSTSLAANSTSGRRYNSVLDMYKNNDNELWVGTFGAGLLKLDLDTKAISHVSQSTLLQSNIYRIIKDKSGIYWMNSNTKIIRYDAERDEIIQFGRLDGTLCREFNDGATFVNQDGDVLMGGFGGFVEFNTENFLFNKKEPLVDINSYYIDNEHNMIGGEVYYNLEYFHRDTLEVTTEIKQLSFYASVLNYQSAEKNKIAWKLDGYSEWDTLMAYDYKVFNGLPAGKYTLRAKGCNNDQVWSTQEDKIFLIVKPTFVDSYWYKGLWVLIGGCILYALYWVRTKYLRKQKQQLEKYVDQRTEELQQVNCELEESREEVMVQKEELERHRYYLEDIVKERTVDLEQAKEKAEQADRLKTAFLANLSHEIRTPMNSIIGFSTLLASDMYDEDDRKEFVGMVQKSSDSLLVLINDIIDISRIETGQVQLVKTKFVLKELCDTVFKTLAFNDNNSEVQFAFEIDTLADDACIYSDLERLKQILINLLNNALKFTAKGHVKLRVLDCCIAHACVEEQFPNEELPEKFYLFSVDDTGVGIDPEYHEHIFSPFQKVENGKDVNGGIGLGLSIVKQLIELLGGKIWLESELGRGTTFFFYLPKGVDGDAYQ